MVYANPPDAVAWLEKEPRVRILAPAVFAEFKSQGGCPCQCSQGQLPCGYTRGTRSMLGMDFINGKGRSHP